MTSSIAIRAEDIDGKSTARQVLRTLSRLGHLDLCYPRKQDNKRHINVQQLAKLITELESHLSRGLMLNLMVHLVLFTPLLIRGARSAALLDITESACKGEIVGATAMTEYKIGGHDFTHISSTIQEYKDSWRVNGHYGYVTNGMDCDWVIVLVRTAGSGPLGLSLMALPANSENLNRSEHLLQVMPGIDIGQLRFNSVAINKSNVIHRKNMAYLALAEHLSLERLLGGVWAIGWVQRCLQIIMYQLQHSGYSLPPPPSIRTQLSDCIKNELALRSLCQTTLAQFSFTSADSKLAATTIKILAINLLDLTLSLHARITGGRGLCADSQELQAILDARVFGIAGGPWDVLDDTLPELYSVTLPNSSESEKG